MKNLLFPKNKLCTSASVGMLVLRIVFAGMLMTHGWAKLADFGATAQQFSAMGGAPAAALVIFAEFFCAAGIVVGLLYRLALIPAIINMSVAFFVAHGAHVTGPQNGEMALLYLTAFVVMLLVGSGKYALDNLFAEK